MPQLADQYAHEPGILLPGAIWPTQSAWTQQDLLRACQDNLHPLAMNKIVVSWAEVAVSITDDAIAHMLDTEE